jgi:hypothetical protein
MATRYLVPVQQLQVPFEGLSSRAAAPAVPSTRQDDTREGSGGGGVSVGMIVAVIASIVIVAIVLASTALLVRRRRRRQSAVQQLDPLKPQPPQQTPAKVAECAPVSTGDQNVRSNAATWLPLRLLTHLHASTALLDQADIAARQSPACALLQPVCHHVRLLIAHTTLLAAGSPTQLC